jgi:transposase
MAAWCRISLTEDEQRIVNAERDGHPAAHVRRKMLFLWTCHCGADRETAWKVAGISRATAERYVAAYRDGGLDGLRRWAVKGPVSDLAAHAEAIKADLDARPARTVAEATERIERLTGIRRGPTQTRTFLAGLGFTWQRTRAVPVPPKKIWPSTSPTSAGFSMAS